VKCIKKWQRIKKGNKDKRTLKSINKKNQSKCIQITAKSGNATKENSNSP
jgi:hypothetical protein